MAGARVAVKSAGRFDAVGAVAISAALVALLLVVSKGASWGWTSALTLGLIAGSLILFTGWTFWNGTLTGRSWI